VSALPRLKCPLRLEPHQIQGLDTKSIFPVVQWLVKKALESREEMMQEQRARAMFEFRKFGQTPEDVAADVAASKAVETVETVQANYSAKRQLKAPDVSEADESTRIQCTLLEYGRRYGLSKVPKADKDKKASKSVKEAMTGGDDEDDLIAAEERRVKSIMKKMSSLGEGGTSAISSSVVGEIAGMQSEEMKRLAEEYNKKAAEIAAAQDKGAGALAAHKRAITGLQKQHEAADAKVDTLQPQNDELQASHDELAAGYTKALAYRKRIDKEMAKLDALEGDESNREALDKLRTLIAQNEQLKEQEKQFKKTCVAEMELFEAKIEGMKGQGAEFMDDERAAAIAKRLQADLAKLEKVKQLSARRNRDIALKQRQIDEYPSRSELNQYQRRFVELYGQVAARLRETKQYYLMYNTVADSKEYYAKEVTLLESIFESFEAAMKSSGGRDQLLKQMDQIATVMGKNKGKVEERQTQEKSERDEMRDNHLKLVEKERLYHKCVKDYESECSKNEKLLTKLKSVQS